MKRYEYGLTGIRGVIHPTVIRADGFDIVDQQSYDDRQVLAKQREMDGHGRQSAIIACEIRKRVAGSSVPWGRVRSKMLVRVTVSNLGDTDFQAFLKILAHAINSKTGVQNVMYDHFVAA
jgi:hypothetical protein